MPRENPYNRLVRIARQWAFDVLNRQRTLVWRYAKADVEQRQAWTMQNLRERTAAANQLGYDVQLEERDGDLYVWYAKRPDSVPWEFRP